MVLLSRSQDIVAEDPVAVVVLGMPGSARTIFDGNALKPLEAATFAGSLSELAAKYAVKRLKFHSTSVVP